MRSFVLLFNCCITFFLISSSGWSQGHFHQVGFFPEIAASIQLNQRWQFTGKVESQHGLYRFQKNTLSKTDYFHDRTDLQAFFDFKLTPFSGIALGYQYRLEGGEALNSHRSIQQISFVQRKMTYRLGHRIRTDQTYEEEAAFEFRLRYRLSAEFPLQGRELEPGEWYLLLSEEIIASLDDSPMRLENRFVTSIGILIADGSKIESGIDYRLDRFLESAGRSRWWWKTGWFLAF